MPKRLTSAANPEYLKGWNECYDQMNILLVCEMSRTMEAKLQLLEDFEIDWEDLGKLKQQNVGGQNLHN